MSDPMHVRRAERWAAITSALIVSALWVGPWLLRPDLFYDDAAHHVFWLYRYADPALFPGDISVEYFKTSAPWGYRAMYWALASVWDAQFIAEALAAIPVILSCLLAWRIGLCSRSSEQDHVALFAVVVVAVLLPLSQQKDLLPPIAFQRSFSFPLLLLTAWALVSRRYEWVGVSWLAAALLYPVVLPVQGLTAAVVFSKELVIKREMPAAWLPNAALGLAALLVAAIGMPIPTEIGPAYSYEHAMRLAEFGPDGRLRMYEEGDVRYWIGGHRAGFGWPPLLLLLIGVATLLAAATDRLRSIPFAAWTMGGVGIGLWAAMRMFPEQLMFALYLPNRHAKWALAVFGVFALAAGAAAAFDWMARYYRTRHPSIDVAIRRGVVVCTPLLVVVALLPDAISVWKRPVDADLEGAYAFIGGLPKDTLVAAHPDLGDFVPLRSQRSVLTSTEISMAWMQGYYAVMKPRVEGSLRAAYATRIEDVDAALEPFGVDVMLTGPSVWEKTGYFAPFDGLVRGLLEQGRREGFALQDPPEDRILFQSGEYYVIRVGACPQGACL